MPDPIKISALDPATTPVAGTEEVAIVQSGDTKRLALSAVRDYVFAVDVTIASDGVWTLNGYTPTGAGDGRGLSFIGGSADEDGAGGDIVIKGGNPTGDHLPGQVFINTGGPDEGGDGTIYLGSDNGVVRIGRDGSSVLMVGDCLFTGTPTFGDLTLFGTGTVGVNSNGVLRITDGLLYVTGYSPSGVGSGGSVAFIGGNANGNGDAGGITLDAGAPADGSPGLISLCATDGDLSLSRPGGKIGLWGATPVVQPAAAEQAALTNSSGGTGDGTLVDVTTSLVADPAKCNDNFTELYTLLDAIRTALVNSGLMKGAA